MHCDHLTANHWPLCHLQHVRPCGSLVLIASGQRLTARLESLHWPPAHDPAGRQLAQYLQALAGGDGRLTYQITTPGPEPLIRLRLDGRDLADYLREQWPAARRAA